MRKTARFKSDVSFWLDNFPLKHSEHPVGYDVVGYVYLESMKCDDCMCQALGDELTFSLEETLNNKTNWPLLVFQLFLHKRWPVVLNNIITYIIIKICHCIAHKTHFVRLWKRVNFTQKLGQSTN